MKQGRSAKNQSRTRSIEKKLGGRRKSAKRFAAIAVEGRKASIETRTLTATKRADDLLPVIADIQAEGATSLRQIAEVLNERGIQTARGGLWSAVQVQRILARA